MEGRGRRSSSSPERSGRATQPAARAGVIRPTPTFKKVQVVYYLSRSNGHLEHPHFMEVTHLAHQPLRLKDVMDRLTVLRGKGMPSLYSWSCKRSYKNGYVWNDLAQNDVIHPSEGAEYVLKGSEILQDTGSTPHEKFHQVQEGNAQQLHIVNLQHTQAIDHYGAKRKPLASKRHPQPEEVENGANFRDEEAEEEEEEEYEEEYEEKTSYASSITPNSRCSRGVSTEHHGIAELQQQTRPTRTQKSPCTELIILDNSSPPSTTSSSISDKANEEKTRSSKRFEDGDPLPTDSLLSRNSVLFQLIACGGSVSFRGKSCVPIGKQPPTPPTPTLPPPCFTNAARKSISGRSTSSSLHDGVLRKAAAKVVVVEEAEAEEIRCMSENPRFANLQAEEKEYFSGSIVETMAMEERADRTEPAGLKKSSSYNEERSSKAGIGGEADSAATANEEAVKKEKTLFKGKCIPRKKSSSSKDSKDSSSK